MTRAPLLIALPGNEAMTVSLAKALDAEVGSLTIRRFPDGETYLRIESQVDAREVILVATLNRPDDKVLSVLFAADDARQLGAASVGLVAPYLAYMRQDQRFKSGEAITSTTFARLLSNGFDYLVTVDPHLHRRVSMREIYTIPVGVVHAAPAISDWIREHVEKPIVIGPDVESAQWVQAVAQAAQAPFTVLTKVRQGDRDVSVTLNDADSLKGRQPVLVDDIISSGRTMEVTIRQLQVDGTAAPVVVGVHGLFAEDAFDRLQAAGAAKIVSSNTVLHVSNRIDLTFLIADCVKSTIVHRV